MHQAGGRAQKERVQQQGHSTERQSVSQSLPVATPLQCYHHPCLLLLRAGVLPLCVAIRADEVDVALPVIVIVPAIRKRGVLITTTTIRSTATAA